MTTARVEILTDDGVESIDGVVHTETHWGKETVVQCWTADGIEEVRGDSVFIAGFSIDEEDE